MARGVTELQLLHIPCMTCQKTTAKRPCRERLRRMQPSGQSLATQRLVINPENPCYRQQEVLFHLPPDRLDSQRLSEDGYARWWLRSRAENEDDDAHDGRRLKSLEVNMSGGFGKCSAGDGSFITRICSIALFAMVNSSQTGVFLSKSPAGTRERSGQPANREVHRIRFVQIRHQLARPCLRSQLRILLLCRSRQPSAPQHGVT